MRAPLLPAAVLLLAACSPKPTGQLAFQLTSKSATNDTTAVSIQYPVPTAGLDYASLARIGKTIESQALAHLENVDENPIPFEHYAENLQHDNADFLKTNLPAESRRWSRQSKTEIVHQTPRFLTLLSTTNSHLAAEPTRFLDYFMIEIPTGRLLTPADVFQPASLSQLAKKPGPLPDNFGRTAEGAVFVYDHDTVVRIPNSEIQPHLRPR